jgi:hypothetical protein
MSPLGRSGYRWEVNMKMGFETLSCRWNLDLTRDTRFLGFVHRLVFQKGTLFRTLYLLPKGRVLFKAPDLGKIQKSSEFYVQHTIFRTLHNLFNWFTSRSICGLFWTRQWAFTIPQTITAFSKILYHGFTYWTFCNLLSVLTEALQQFTYAERSIRYETDIENFVEQ